MQSFKIYTGQHLWQWGAEWCPFYVHEWSVGQFLRSRATEDVVFMDAGAQIGYFTVVLAPYVRRVVAVEPRVTFADLLRKAVETNNLDNVIVIEKGLHDTDGEYGSRVHGSTITVADNGLFPLTTVDAVMNGDQLDLIKIDVEGAEIKVLQGAAETIEQYHPTMMIEMHPGRIKTYFGQDPLEVLEILWTHGYCVEMLPRPAEARWVTAQFRDCRGYSKQMFLGATYAG